MVKTINRDLLRRKLQEAPGRTVLVDVRDRPDYEDEHIKGAISIPLDELQMRAEREFGTDEEIIVYCESFQCPASTKAARMLSDFGYENVLEYEGGLTDWKTAGFLTEGRERAA